MKLVLLASLITISATTVRSCKKEECKEQLKEDCICTMEYNPVCGCNQKTYSNACEAQCHGINNYVKGECPNK